MGSDRAFKNYFDAGAARALGAQVAAVYDAFDQERFVAFATEGLEALEMVDRVRRFSQGLHAELPSDVERALGILTSSLPPALEGADAVTDGYLQWPVGQFIADYGVEHLDASWDAMIELTQRLTSEFAVRPFVERYPDQVFARLRALTDHESVHVRRWCSEGVRPRLPWGKRLESLVVDPTPVFPILDALKDDPELYVRKSVANCLNDVAKDHPERVLDLVRTWMKDATAPRAWLVRHALRTLVKEGDPRALEVLGYGAPRGVSATLSVTPGAVEIGERVKLTLDLESAQGAELLVDFRIHYRKANGDARPKVFKWTKLRLRAGQHITLTKSVTMRVTTIRPLYPGRHLIDAQVNGMVLAKASFELRPPRPGTVRGEK